MAISTSPISSSFAPLHELTSLMSSSLASLESTCTSLNVPWPSLDEPNYASQTPGGPSKEDAARLKNEAIARASATIVAAAMQLVASVQEPGVSALKAGGGFHLSSAIRTVTELHVVDILRDAGAEGLHVDEIAKKIKVDPSKLARILRLLATHHIFTERRPNVFANNRVSAVLEKGQSVEKLIANPAGKYDRPESALSALLCHFGDEVFKSSTHLFESLVDPSTAFSGSPSKCAWSLSPDLNSNPDVPNQASPSTSNSTSTSVSTPTSTTQPARNTTTTTNTNAATPHTQVDTQIQIQIQIQIQNTAPQTEEIDLSGPTMWDVLARPGPAATYLGFEKERLRRFGVAMEGGGKVHPVEEVLGGFDFAALPPSSIIVDVGGGVGSVAQLLVRKYKNGQFKIVVQDREEVCEEGVRRWKETNPEALDSGRVSFQAQSFFSPQPTQPTPSPKPTAYLLKHILHDWSDACCRTILKHLRNAVDDSDSDSDSGETAQGRTRLLVLDSIVPYASRGSEDKDEDEDEDKKARREIPGVYQDAASPPLLPNWGVAGGMPYLADLVMLSLLNGQERTLAHMRALFRGCGWEIVKVTQSRTVGQALALVEARAV